MIPIRVILYRKSHSASLIASSGQWAVKDQPGWFSNVGADMKVEQGIQQVSKGPDGHYVVSETRKAGAVVEFAMLYHEIASITHLLYEVTANPALKDNKCQLPKRFESQAPSNY